MTFSFNWIFVTLPDLFYTHKTCQSFYLDHWAHSFSKGNLFKLRELLREYDIYEYVKFVEPLKKLGTPIPRKEGTSPTFL